MSVKIHIEDLTPKEYNLGFREQDKAKLVNCYKYNITREYAFYSNGKRCNFYYPHYFIGTYLHCYNTHSDAIFKVTDIWNLVVLFLSKYINDNAELLRRKFVSHEGSKKLVVVEESNSIKESLEMEKKWDYFFEQIIEQIRVNTNEGVVESLENDFSTSTQFDKIFSTASIMHSFKQYFTYGRMICMCGIPNVYFDGTDEDWLKLKNKIIGLNKYAATQNGEDKLTKYINHVIPIIDQFILTRSGVIDLNFWHTIMKTKQRHIGSGGDTKTTLQGWITHFIGEYGSIAFEDITAHKLEVPIELVNQLTQAKKDLTLYGGFTGVCYDQERNAFYPEMSLILYENDKNK